MAQATTTQEWSILHLLSHSQQMDVFRTYVRIYDEIHTSLLPARRTTFEDLSTEVRLMIFESFIRFHHFDHKAPHDDVLRLIYWLFHGTTLANWREVAAVYHQARTRQYSRRGHCHSPEATSVPPSHGTNAASDLAPLYHLYIAESSPLLCVWALEAMMRIMRPKPIPKTTRLHEALALVLLFVDLALALPHAIDYVYCEQYLVNEVTLPQLCALQHRSICRLPISNLNKQLRAEALNASMVVRQRLRRKNRCPRCGIQDSEDKFDDQWPED